MAITLSGTTGINSPTTALAGSVSGVVTLTGAANAGTWTFTMPTTAGTSGYILQTDGSGVTTWVASAGGGNVSNSGTPTAGQIATWVNSTTVQGTSVLPSANGGTGVNNGFSTLTLSANNTAAQFINNAVAVTVTSNAGTVPITSKVNNFTNSSAATMAITIAVTGAVDGQMSMVRIYDFSAATQTIGWTNTENSTVSVPTTSNGSTTLPLTVGFQYNGQTSKWRCVAIA